MCAHRLAIASVLTSVLMAPNPLFQGLTATVIRLWTSLVPNQMSLVHDATPAPQPPPMPRTRPKVQTQLLLHKPHQPYELYHEASIPTLEFGELMVEILAIGLNPIDWKSAYVKRLVSSHILLTQRYYGHSNAFFTQDLWICLAVTSLPQRPRVCWSHRREERRPKMRT
jgi:hypothetical protein